MKRKIFCRTEVLGVWEKGSRHCFKLQFLKGQQFEILKSEYRCSIIKIAAKTSIENVNWIFLMRIEWHFVTTTKIWDSTGKVSYMLKSSLSSRPSKSIKKIGRKAFSSIFLPLCMFDIFLLLLIVWNWLDYINICLICACKIYLLYQLSCYMCALWM